MKKFIARAIIFFVAAQGFHAHLAGQTWTFKTVGNGIKPAIAVDQDNNPHIVYMDESFSGFVKLADFQNEEFSSTTVTTGYFYGPPDLVIDANDRAYIVYHNHDTEDLELGMEQANGTWVIEQIQSTNHDGWDGSLFAGFNGEIHMASVDPSAGVEYAFYDGVSEIVELPGSGSFTYRWGTDIIVDLDGTIHMAYYQGSDGDLQYATRQNGVWNIESVVTGGQFPSMVKGEGNSISIAYYRTISGPVGTISIATKTPSGWMVSNVDTLSDIAISGVRKIVDLEYANENYHMAYSDRKYLYYSTRIDTAWKIETVLNLLGQPTVLGQLTSLEIDGVNNPHIAYYESTNSVSEGGIIKYATKQNIPSLLVDCPENQTYYCATDNSPEFTGEPIILNNPGISININYTDTNEPRDCGSESDELTRTWTINNDLNQTINCSQTITNIYYDLDEMVFPPNRTISNVCYEDILNQDYGSISGICPSLSINIVDSIINPECIESFSVLRQHMIMDDCEVLFIDTQMIQVQSILPFELTDLVVEPDTGSGTGSIHFTPFCGAEPYSYFWSNGSEATNLLVAKPGTYSVTVIDNIQCLEILTAEITGISTIPIFQGSIRRPNGTVIQDVDVSLNFLDDEVDLLDCIPSAPGIDFCILDSTHIDGEIELCLSKSDDAALNVSAIDIVKAQRIILGFVEPCPYNLIAGDVNLSGTLSASDLVLIQRVILGFDSTFPSGASWIFYKGEEEIECDIFNAENIPYLDLEYIGVKLGDLNCEDMSLFRDEIPELRSTGPAKFLIENARLFKGERKRISFQLDEVEKYLAFQNRFTFNPADLSIVEIESPLIASNEFVFRATPTDLSFLAHSASTLRTGTMSTGWIEVEAKKDLILSDVLHLDSDYQNLAYDKAFQELVLDLEFTHSDSQGITTQQEELHLFPNPFSRGLYLEFQRSGLSPVDLVIRDVHGKRVFHQFYPVAPEHQIELNLSELSPGVYFLEYAGNQTKIIRKLIKVQ